MPGLVDRVDRLPGPDRGGLDPLSDGCLARADRELLGALGAGAGAARGDRVSRIFLGGGRATEANRVEPRYLDEGGAGAV